MTDFPEARPAIALMLVAALMATVSYALLSPLIVFAGSSNVVGGNVVIPNTCVPIISNTIINFGSTPPGTYQPTANAENLINFGNAAANIIVNGGNWISTTPNRAFHVSNTLWSATSGGNIGTQLTNTINGGPAGGDTKIPLKANGGGNTVFFGVNVPVGQANSGITGESGYAQTINVMLSC